MAQAQSPVDGYSLTLLLLEPRPNEAIALAQLNEPNAVQEQSGNSRLDVTIQPGCADRRALQLELGNAKLRYL